MAQTPERSTKRGGMPDGVLVGILACLLGGTVLCWVATGLAGLISHGRWPPIAFSRTPLAIRHLVLEPSDLATAWGITPTATGKAAAGAAGAGDKSSGLPSPQAFWLVAAALLLLLFALICSAIIMWAHHRVRQAVAQGGPEVKAVEPAPESSATAELPQVPQVPIPSPAADPPPAAPAGGDFPAALDRTCCLFADALTDKANRVIQPAVTGATGALLVTCASAATWTATAPARWKLGPVHVFDPLHRTGAVTRLRWAPHDGCDEPTAAINRARAILAPLRAPGDAVPMEAAQTVLRCLLHAAAIDGRPFRHVHRWANGTETRDAIRILGTDGYAADGWDGELATTLATFPDSYKGIQELLNRALGCLSELHIRDACSPSSSEWLNPESFLAERGTLYVVGDPIEDPRSHPGAMPIFTALVSYVVEFGRRA